MQKQPYFIFPNEIYCHASKLKTGMLCVTLAIKMLHIYSVTSYLHQAQSGHLTGRQFKICQRKTLRNTYQGPFEASPGLYSYIQLECGQGHSSVHCEQERCGSVSGSPWGSENSVRENEWRDDLGRPSPDSDQEVTVIKH